MDDAAVPHDVDAVGDDVVEEALVVGDDEEARVRAAHGVDAFGDDAERVDVEAGVGLVEDGVLRLEHHQLEDLAALLLAAGEAFVDEAGGELPVHLEGVHLGVELGVVGLGVEGRALGLAGDERGADEVGDGHAGDLAGILEGEEEAGAGDDIRLEADDLFAVEEGFARLHGVVGVAGEDLGERALAGAVRPHDGVHFALRDREGEILQDRAVADGGVEVLDDERVRHGGRLVGRGGVLGLGTAVEADFDDFGVEAGREDRAEALEDFGRELDVMDSAGGLVAEVGVRGQVGAVAGGLALVVDLTNQAAADEGLEAVVDRGEGEAWHDLPGPVEDFVDRGVVAFGQEDGEDGLALGGDFLAALYEGFLKVFLILFGEISNHSNSKQS